MNSGGNAVIVNFGRGGWYPDGTRRLFRQCRDFGVPFQGWDNYPPECPTHFDVPYAFKPAVVRHARKEGFDIVVWADSSASLQHDPVPLFDHIREHGVFVSANGWNCAQWTSDECLRIMGVTRDEAEKMPHASALVIGFDFRDVTACTLFSKWAEGATNGAYIGPWKNIPKTEKQTFREAWCSDDPRCLGHRHDQSVLSIVTNLMKIPHVPMGKFLDYGADKKDAIFAAYPV